MVSPPLIVRYIYYMYLYIRYKFGGLVTIEMLMLTRMKISKSCYHMTILSNEWFQFMSFIVYNCV
ncbi:unnamed protein product, partial [Staurois parvus]